MLTRSQVSRSVASAICGGLSLIAWGLLGGCATAKEMPPLVQASSDVNQAAPGTEDSYVKASVREITVAESLRAKRQRSQALSQWVARHPDDVFAADIDALASLLSDPDDGVRGWIAGALGKLGHKAERAVPKLQRALQERPCVDQPLASADAIRLALSRIGAQPTEADKARSAQADGCLSRRDIVLSETGFAKVVSRTSFLGIPGSAMREYDPRPVIDLKII